MKQTDLDYKYEEQIGDDCVIEPGAKVVGVKIANGHYVPMGSAVNDQREADNLPRITSDYMFKSLNAGVVHVNVQLADAYNHKLPKELSNQKGH